VDHAERFGHRVVWLDVQETQAERDRRHRVAGRQLHRADVLGQQRSQNRRHARKRHVPGQHVHAVALRERPDAYLLAGHPLVQKEPAAEFDVQHVVHAAVASQQHADPVGLGFRHPLRIAEQLHRLPHVQAAANELTALPLPAHPVQEADDVLERHVHELRTVLADDRVDHGLVELRNGHQRTAVAPQRHASASARVPAAGDQEWEVALTFARPGRRHGAHRHLLARPSPGTTVSQPSTSGSRPSQIAR
jgi:hypothetical protein